MKNSCYHLIYILILAVFLAAQTGCGLPGISSPAASGTFSAGTENSPAPSTDHPAETVSFSAPSASFPDGATVSSSSDGKYVSSDILGNQYVSIPEGTRLILYEGDPAATRSEMADALADYETSVCIKNQAVWYDTPDFYAMPYSTFWLEDMAGIGYYGQTKDDDSNCFYHFYELTYYDYTEEELAQMKAQIDSAAAEIISLVPESADTWTKALIVHDELCRLVSYDQTHEAPHSHDTYGALVNHQAVCSGYACAFSHIMTLLDSYCPLSYSDDHAWNHVGVPSDQEYIDVTWDDMDLEDAGGDPYINYDYFFLTREEVESIDSHSIESMDPFTTASDPQPYNYHEHEGYLVFSYDWDTIVSMYAQQLQTGTNYLTIRFQNEEDYLLACQWKENDFEEMYALLTELDYFGSYYYWYNDDRQTVSFGLYAPEE